MRVLVSSPGGVGHATPLVPLAWAMAAAGAEVRIACPSPAADRLVEIGLPVQRIGLSAQAAHERCLERYPEIRSMPGSQLPGYVFPRLFGDVTAAAQFPDLFDIARSWQPSVLVHDAGDLAAPVVAAAIGVPNVCHGFGTVIPPATVAAAAERTEPLWATVGLTPRPYGGCFDHLYVDPFPPSLQPQRSEHLGRVIAEAPQAAAAAPSESIPPAVANALASGLPLVHVTFGTVYNSTPTFEAAVEAASRLDAVVLVTVGPGGDISAFRKYGVRVHVERFVAQSLVMPRTAALASHAGSGTVMAALQHGGAAAMPAASSRPIPQRSRCRSRAARLRTPQKSVQVRSYGISQVSAAPCPRDVVTVVLDATNEQCTVGLDWAHRIGRSASPAVTARRSMPPRTRLRRHTHTAPSRACRHYSAHASIAPRSRRMQRPEPLSTASVSCRGRNAPRSCSDSWVPRSAYHSRVTATFNELVTALNAPLVIVTAASRGDRAGCLVGFHGQCSIDPPRYAVWLSKANHTCRTALQSTHLAVHILGACDMRLAELFGTTTGDEIDKFKDHPTSTGPGEVPILTECPHRFVGRRTTILEDGSDHICFIIEPEQQTGFGGGDIPAPLRLHDVSYLRAGHPAEEHSIAP